MVDDSGTTGVSGGTAVGVGVTHGVGPGVVVEVGVAVGGLVVLVGVGDGCCTEQTSLLRNRSPSAEVISLSSVMDVTSPPRSTVNVTCPVVPGARLPSCHVIRPPDMVPPSLADRNWVPAGTFVTSTTPVTSAPASAGIS